MSVAIGGGGRLEKALGDVLAYLITGEAAGRVCSLEIMTDEQTGPAEYSMAHVALETGAAIEVICWPPGRDAPWISCPVTRQG